MLEFSRDLLRYYIEWSRDYGDIVALQLGAWPAVLLNNSDYAEYVLVRNHRNFIKFQLFFRHVRAIFGQGLLTSEGEFWHRQRRLAAPAFHAQRVAAYGAAMMQDTERMLATWRPNELRDVHTDMMALTLRIAAKTLFNAEVDEDVPRSARPSTPSRKRSRSGSAVPSSSPMSFRRRAMSATCAACAESTSWSLRSSWNGRRRVVIAATCSRC
jgi:cytochrome P450